MDDVRIVIGYGQRRNGRTTSRERACESGNDMIEIPWLSEKHGRGTYLFKFAGKGQSSG